LLDHLYNVMQRPQVATIKELIALACCVIQRKRGISVRWSWTSYLLFSCIWHPHTELTAKKLGHKGVDFYVQNALKFTYENL